MKCSTLCLLLCAALVSGAPSLLPGDPNYSPDHAHNHGEHAHDHGEHVHDHGAPAHDHGAPAHDHGAPSHDHGAHAHDHVDGAHTHDQGEGTHAHAQDQGAHAHAQDQGAHAHAQDQGAHAHAQDQGAHAHAQDQGAHAHDHGAHPEPQAHDGQAHSDQAQPGQAFPGQEFAGQAFPGQKFAGQAFPGQEFAGQAFPGQDHPGQAHPGQASPEPGSSLTKGIPDFPVSYAASGDASAETSQTVSAVSSQTVAQPPAVSAPQPSKPAKVARPSNPFLSGNVQLPSSSSFKVPVKPVLPPAQRPTQEPIKKELLNTNPLGGPAGPKGAVRASCPGPASALPCVPDDECDPYTGILKSDGVKLPYPITKDTPTVAIDQCKLGTGVGVCCKHLPKPKPIITTTAVPLGVDYGQGLEHLKQPPTEKPINPFLPEYRPAY